MKTRGFARQLWRVPARETRIRGVSVVQSGFATDNYVLHIDVATTGDDKPLFLSLEMSCEEAEEFGAQIERMRKVAMSHRGSR